MSKYQVDRDTSYMRENWGTTQLITDYVPQTEKKTKVIQEVMHDAEKTYDEELMNDFTYGLEPNYKIRKGHILLSD